MIWAMFPNTFRFTRELINTYPKAHFYVMAVNPVDDVKYPSLVQRNKTTKLVTIFNSLLKSAFPDCYIDTYSYLESSGYETLDGCHYTTATYLKIYHYTLSEIQKERQFDTDSFSKKNFEKLFFREKGMV